jgi:hypothetical protein
MSRGDDHRAAKWADRQRRQNRKHKHHLSAWESRIRAVGLQIDPAESDRFSACGRSKGCVIRVQANRRGESWTWELTAHNKHIDPRISIAPEQEVSWLQKVLSEPEIEIGDPLLDRIARIYGPQDLLLAVLSETTRRRLVSLLERGGGATDRTVRLTVTTEEARPGWVPDRAGDLATLARQLACPRKKLIPGLIRAADRDPLPDIQKAALLVLLQHHPARIPQRMLREGPVVAALDSLSDSGLIFALQSLQEMGTSLSLPHIAVHARFPSGNNATRKAAKKAARAIALRNAPDGALVMVDETPSSAQGGLSLKAQGGELSPAEGQ